MISRSVGQHIAAFVVNVHRASHSNHDVAVAQVCGGCTRISEGCPAFDDHLAAANQKQARWGGINHIDVRRVSRLVPAIAHRQSHDVAAQRQCDDWGNNTSNRIKWSAPQVGQLIAIGIG